MAGTRIFSPATPVRVFLVDDHEVVRQGIRDLLDGEPDIEVIGEAGTVGHALAEGPALRPDVALLDVRLPGGDGITVCRELRSHRPELACLMLTSFDDDDALLDAVMAGAAGYVLRQIKGADLASTVRTVASGRSMLDPATTARLRTSLRRDEVPGPDGGAPPQLSPRERDVLVLVGEGLTNRQIGTRLSLSENAVRDHVSRLLAELGVERRVRTTVLAAARIPSPLAGYPYPPGQGAHH